MDMFPKSTATTTAPAVAFVVPEQVIADIRAVLSTAIAPQGSSDWSKSRIALLHDLRGGTPAVFGHEAFENTIHVLNTARCLYAGSKTGTQWSSRRDSALASLLELNPAHLRPDHPHP